MDTSPGDGTVPIATGPGSGPSGTPRELQSHAGQPSSPSPASVAPVITKDYYFLDVIASIKPTRALTSFN